MGLGNYKRSAEEKNISFRRSLYFVRGLEKGAYVKKEDIRSIRPGFGLEPKFLKK